MASLLIRDVVVEGRRTNIFCENGRIAAIDGEPRAADSVLEGRGMLAMPPLINSHTHSAMTLFRGNGDDLPLMEWLETKVWPYEQGITEEEVYWGAKLACLEMVKNGIGFFNDMYWDFHAVARAVEETGLRAHLSAVFIDFGDAARAKEQERTNIRLIEEVRQYSDRIRFAVGPHAIYTVTEPALRWAAEFTAEHDIILHTHLSETEQEVRDCHAQHGCSPVEYLHRLGMLSPRLVAAHTIWLSEEDIRLLGEHRVVCAHNPVSNMKLAVNGVYPYSKLKDAGAVTAIATDGAGSNNNLDLLEELKVAALLQKFHNNDPTALPAGEALDMAIENPAHVFGLSGKKLFVGREADILLIDLGKPEMNPPHSLASHLVYSANGSVVDSLVVDGRVLMEHRVVEGEEEIVAKANEAAGRMVARVDETVS